MCVYSMIAEHYIEKWSPPPQQPFPPLQPVYVPYPQITPEEVEELRKLLERAKKYDREHDEPNCELDEKKKILKELAKEWGIEIELP